MSILKSRRVLIVDDEQDLTEALAIRLSSGWGFTVSVAHEGEEGLRKASAFKPDVILLDIAMPLVDGWEVCRRLRDDPDTRHIPIVIMTAWSTDYIHRLAAEEGVSEVLLKPAEDHELLAALRDATGTVRPDEGVAAGGARQDRRRAPRGRAQARRPHGDNGSLQGRRGSS
ncbi:MAG: response regulator [Elusimicrobia bacterium]|nr:response regulator [Elusimicrobiota bacterium]